MSTHPDRWRAEAEQLARKVYVEHWNIPWIADAILRLVERVQPQWQPMETAPKDGSVVLRPHRIWGAMDVRYITDADAERVSVLASGIPWRWLNGDYTTAWTDSAFLPFWMPLPPAPGAAAASPSGERQQQCHAAIHCRLRVGHVGDHQDGRATWAIGERQQEDGR